MTYEKMGECLARPINLETSILLPILPWLRKRCVSRASTRWVTARRRLLRPSKLEKRRARQGV